MVDPVLVEMIRKLLDGPPRRYLITGGTGFIGSRVATLLAAAGQSVTVIGRNRYRAGRRLHPDVKIVVCDLQQRGQLGELCGAHDVIIHAAAHSATWGPAEAFQQTNVAGTRHVVEACLAAAKRFVHISSTAIHFEFRDKLDVQDNDPLPDKFACQYAQSKADAEQVVQRAVANGLDAVIVRARAAIGPGDNQLLPRLLAAARDGRLPQIGDGRNRVDLTYVDNLAYAICLATVRGQAGAVCTITNEQPLELWPTLDKLFQQLGMQPIRRRVPYRVALSLATVTSVSHRLLRFDGEPKLTPYSVGLLAKSQTFSPKAAREVLGYRPVVPIETGIQRTLQSLQARDDSFGSVHCDLELLTTGYTTQRYRLAERGGPPGSVRFHALCALIRHPSRGVFLFDTGYAPRIHEALKPFPFSLYGRMLPAVTSPRLALVEQLKERGIVARDVSAIILSHLHADHAAGIRDFPQADLIMSARTRQATQSLRGLSAMRHAYVPALMPDDLLQRLHTIEHFRDPGIGDFDQTHDLFGDGSVRLISLPGHAHGQIGALVQTGPAQRTFLVADATWTLGSLSKCQLPHPITFLVADSVADMRDSLNRLHAFSQKYPETIIVPTHSPEIAEQFHFDRTIEALRG
jgi:nucleoside-diphosphate-sugar epimerase/glyoxylase-like metal-dependent hydrolase (beta-lactamase superfamily II)